MSSFFDTSFRVACPAVPTTWNNIESAAVDDPSFVTATSSCGCTPDNPRGQPVGLSVLQDFGSVEFSWTVGSACESGVSITRSLVDPITKAPEATTTTVAQLSIGLPCNSLYRPSKTEVDEDIMRDALKVRMSSRQHSMCTT